MADNYALRELDPDARRVQRIWNGAALGTNGGGTKYFDGAISAPANANPCYQLAKAGTAKSLVVNIRTNGGSAGGFAVYAKALTAAGVTLTLGNVTYTTSQTGVKSATLTGALDDGAVIWLEVVSFATFNSSNVIGSALVEYWTSI